jgi:diguanylate cyclase (GGDEF)-like protein
MVDEKYLKNSLILVSLLFFAVVTTAAIFYINLLFKNKKEFIEQQSLTKLESAFKSVRLSYVKISHLLFDEVINTHEVVSLYTKASSSDKSTQDMVRERLYSRLNPTYERLKEMNIKQLHFHLKDNSSFLRFHKPSKYGDNLTGIRRSLEITNREQRYVEGFEEGRIFNGFRHVFPLLDKDSKHLGSVETSVSSVAVSNDIQNVHKGSIVDFIIKKDIVSQKVWKSEQHNYEESNIHPKYLREKNPRYNLVQDKLNEINKKISSDTFEPLNNEESYSRYRDGYVVSFLPIKNVEGNVVSYIIMYAKSDILSSAKKNLFVLKIAITVLTALISFLIYFHLLSFAKIKNMALKDNLTKVHNRRFLSRAIKSEILRTKRYKRTFCLIYFDIDHFKRINDSFGHATGDRVLQELVVVVNDTLRTTDIFGRWGGEEFIAILPETTKDNAMIAIEKLRKNIASYDFNLSQVNVTCSFGIAEYQDGENSEDILKRADQALYKSKVKGRDRVTII